MQNLIADFLFRLLAQHEGKFSGTFEPCARIEPVEPDSIIEAQQTEHGKIKPHAEADRSTQFKWIVIFKTKPSVGSFKKRKSVYGAACAGAERVSHLQRVLIEYGEKVPCLTQIRVNLRIGIIVNGIAAVCYDIIAQQTIVIAQACIS